MFVFTAGVPPSHKLYSKYLYVKQLLTQDLSFRVVKIKQLLTLRVKTKQLGAKISIYIG